MTTSTLDRFRTPHPLKNRAEQGEECETRNPKSEARERAPHPYTSHPSWRGAWRSDTRECDRWLPERTTLRLQFSRVIWGSSAVLLALFKFYFKFPPQPHQKYYITHEELGFHSLLRWKMIILPILTTILIHISVEGWENVLLNLGVEGLSHHMFSRDQASCQPVGHSWRQLRGNPLFTEKKRDFAPNNKASYKSQGGGGGGTHIYKPYRYVPPQRVSFSSFSSLK